MNKEIAKLLEKLAEKFGTTSEYLWEVLVTQAPIQGSIILFQLIVIILIGFGILKVHKKLLEKDLYNEWEVGAGVPMIIAVIIWVVFLIIGFCHIPEMIYAFINPEYWALKEVLGQF